MNVHAIQYKPHLKRTQLYISDYAYTVSKVLEVILT